MSPASSWLPEIILLEAYKGEWGRYLEALYSVFKRDFLDSKPQFLGRNIALKRYPMENGKEATFWHFISEGKCEEDRLPDMRRCERIPWPRPIIESHETEQVLSWTTTRNGERRILLALDDFSYLVVLADRGHYVLPWTAYCVERDHQRRKLKREYEASKCP